MTTENPAEEAATGAPSIADILAGNTSSIHDGHREVGGAPPELDAAPPPQAAPAAEAPPASPAPAAQAAADPAADPKAPRWYRDHIQKTNRELAQTRAELERARTSAPSQPRQAAQFNPAEDPEGFLGEIERRFQQQQLIQTLTISERFSRREHGAEAFEDCRTWLSTKPDIEAWALQQPDPWGAAFQQFQRERLAEEIGDDPNAWRDRERERLRQEILAEQQPAQAPAAAPQMRATPPLPASTARSSAPDRDPSGRFTGPRPIGALTKHKFG